MTLTIFTNNSESFKLKKSLVNFFLINHCNNKILIHFQKSY